MNTYQTEVKEVWGHTEAYAEHRAKTGNYSRQTWDALAEEMDNIFGKFAASMKNGEGPDSVTVQDHVQALKDHISASYYTCTNEILAGLGQMYVQDVRFRDHIDRQGVGTAEFVSRAIEIYCAAK